MQQIPLERTQKHLRRDDMSFRQIRGAIRQVGRLHPSESDLAGERLGVFAEGVADHEGVFFRDLVVRGEKSGEEYFRFSFRIFEDEAGACAPERLILALQIALNGGPGMALPDEIAAMQVLEQIEADTVVGSSPPPKMTAAAISAALGALILGFFIAGFTDSVAWVMLGATIGAAIGVIVGQSLSLRRD